MSTTEMRTVELEWTEVSHHRATVNVPPGLDLACVDLGDALSDAGFTGVEREGIVVRVFEHDVSAPTFDPV